MELEETFYGLELLIGSEVVSPQDGESIKNEAEELIRIFVSLVKKWKP